MRLIAFEHFIELDSKSLVAYFFQETLLDRLLERKLTLIFVSFAAVLIAGSRANSNLLANLTARKILSGSSRKV